MLDLSKNAILIVVATAILLASLLRSFLDPLSSLDLDHFCGPRVSSLDGSTQGGAEGSSSGSCRMAWMHPSYFKLSLSNSSRLSRKYSVYLYREQGWDPEKPVGLPVLFIPGNTGSYRQVRSIASAASHAYFEFHSRIRSKYLKALHPGLDFYTLDFNEEFSAFNGDCLMDQADFANQALQFILSMYTNKHEDMGRSGLPRPESVLILAHSMGGIVARKMMIMPNYGQGTINTIITISTPHLMPPITFDQRMEAIYHSVNQFWRQSYIKQTFSPSLANLVLVAISGGTADTTISSDSTSLITLAPPSNSLTVFTTAIPGVWTPIDHLAIVWCDQLRRILAQALLDLSDPKQPSGVGSVQDRLRILRSHLVHGHGLLPSMEPHHSLNHAPQNHFLSGSDSIRILLPNSPLRLTGDHLQGVPELQTHVIPISPSTMEGGHSQFDQFNLLTNLIGDASLSVLACHGQLQNVSLNSCQSFSSSSVYSYLVPQSRFDLSPAPDPGSNSEPDPVPMLNYMSIPSTILSTYDFVAVRASAKPKSGSPSKFVVAEFRSLGATTQILQDSLWRLCIFGSQVYPLSQASTLVSELRLPEHVSSLLAFRLRVERPAACERQGEFAPMMQQYTYLNHESKFHPNIRTAVLSNHFSSAYSPRIRSSEPKGMLLRFWVDSMACEDSANLKIKIKLDLTQSGRKILLRLRTAFVSISIGVTCLVLLIQIRGFVKFSKFDSFGTSFSILIHRHLVKILVCVVMVQLLQSIVLQPHNPGQVSTAGETSEAFTMNEPHGWVSSLLIGDYHSVFSLLDVLIVLLGTGCVGLVYLTVEAILRALAHSWVGFLGPSLQQHGRQFSPSPQICKTRTITLVGLALFTLLWAPYHMAYLLIVLLHFSSALRALILLCRSENSKYSVRRQNQSRYNLLVSVLVLMLWLIPSGITFVLVWFRNLQEGTYGPFYKTDRNLLKIVGFMAWVAWCEDQGAVNIGQECGEIPTKIGTQSGQKELRLGRCLVWFLQVNLLGVGLFSIFYGIRLTYLLFELLNVTFFLLGFILSIPFDAKKY